MTRVELKWKVQKEIPTGFPFPSPKSLMCVTATEEGHVEK